MADTEKTKIVLAGIPGGGWELRERETSNNLVSLVYGPIFT